MMILYFSKIMQLELKNMKNTQRMSKVKLEFKLKIYKLLIVVALGKQRNQLEIIVK